MGGPMRTQITESVSKTKLRRPHRKSKGVRRHIREQKARGRRGVQSNAQKTQPAAASTPSLQWVYWSGLPMALQENNLCPYVACGCFHTGSMEPVNDTASGLVKRAHRCPNCRKLYRPYYKPPVTASYWY